MGDVDSLDKRLNRVEEKILRLKKADPTYSFFGSKYHKYSLNPTLSEASISFFENTHRIRLPLDYRCFVRFLGDGGAGPFYGLGQLANGIFVDMDNRGSHVIDLSEPFAHTRAWNLACEDFEDHEAYEREYFDDRHASGLLRLCNFGCGVFINLVVNGAEYGKMWTDDRGSDNGIYPSAEFGNARTLTFIEWYELWLDKSLEDLKDE